MSLVVYKSSAGSGKTFTLVKEYLKLVIENPDNYKHILAITFTNKAANEMKSRILTSLATLAGNSKGNDSLLVLLAAELKNALPVDDSSLQQRASLALVNILHGYSGFAVSTIDSFVNKLVRNFARELKLPVNFDLELDENKLITKSIELLLDKVGTDTDLTHTLVQFVESKMEDEKSWDIERELRTFTKILLKENSVNALHHIRQLEAGTYIKISKQLAILIHDAEDVMSRPGIEAMQLIQSANLSAGDFAYGNSGIFSFFKRIAIKDFSRAIHTSNQNIVKMLNTGKWTSGKCEQPAIVAIENIQDQLSAKLDIIVQNAGQLLPKYNLFTLIHQNIYPTAVLSEIEKVMGEFRENENIVHISEFNKRIADIVGSEPVPFIYERIGEKYHHFLVDEFQDTSLLQWQNLLPLFENSLAGNYFNMIVGDGKQAIYRWRNGEVEQFAALPKIYNRPDNVLSQQRETLLGQHFDEKFLTTNYRSRKEIVEFNNEFFEVAAQQLSENLQKIYHNQKQQVNPEAIGGLVHIEFLEVREPDSETFEHLELERIRAIVEDLQTTFNLNEISILTRTNGNASLIARHLIDNNISVVTNEALLLSSSHEVRFIISLLRFLNDPAEPTVIAEILLFLIEKTNRPSFVLHELLNGCSEIYPHRQGTNSLEFIIRRQLHFEFDRVQLQNCSLYEMVEKIVRNFELNETEDNPFIRFFRDAILEFNSKNDENSDDFLTYWDEIGKDKSIVIPEETEAVRVMTIHKAKGLQFPVVIYPFANGNDKLGLNEFWIEPELEELPLLKTALVKATKTLEETKFASLRQKETEKSFLDLLNVLYVAMTRPVERMYVLLHDKHNAAGKWNNAKAFNDVADLFHNYLQQKELWEKQKPIYTFGHTGDRISNEKSTLKKTDDQWQEIKLEKGNWQQTAVVRIKTVENPDIETTDNNRNRGIMIHYILAKIKTHDDIPDALDEAIVEGMLPVASKYQLISELNQILSSPAILSFYDRKKKIFTEKEIILKNGQTLRPDRIVIDTGETAVIDYKTGKKDANHKNQVEAYALALHEMDYTNIKKYLVYIALDEHKVEVISW